jgi:predicted HicB family RNase H-like nuclease
MSPATAASWYTAAMSDANTPPRTPRRETRQQWTLKHRDLTPELRQLVAKAAERQGMPVGAWVAHVLRDRAQAAVRSDDEPHGGVPAVPP